MTPTIFYLVKLLLKYFAINSECSSPAPQTAAQTIQGLCSDGSAWEMFARSYIKYTLPNVKFKHFKYRPKNL